MKQFFFCFSKYVFLSAFIFGKVLFLSFYLVSSYGIWPKYFYIAYFYVKLVFPDVTRKLGSDSFSNFTKLSLLLFLWNVQKYSSLLSEISRLSIPFIFATSYLFFVSVFLVLLNFVRPCPRREPWLLNSESSWSANFWNGRAARGQQTAAHELSAVK